MGGRGEEVRMEVRGWRQGGGEGGGSESGGGGDEGVLVEVRVEEVGMMCVEKVVVRGGVETG